MSRMSIGSLTSLLKALPKSMSVKVFTNDLGYTDKIYVWEEGHDYRHFIELMYNRWDNKPKSFIVEDLLSDLNKCYKNKSNNYRNDIYINVDAPPKYRSSTSVIDATVKNGVLYLKGNKPSWIK